MTDKIHPEHYRNPAGVELIDIIEQLNFNRGNVVKYVYRAGRKYQEDELCDLMKAHYYLTREIERLKREQEVEE